MVKLGKVVKYIEIIMIMMRMIIKIAKNNKLTMDKLPNELIYHICSKMDLDDMLSFVGANLRYYVICMDIINTKIKESFEKHFCVVFLKENTAISIFH